MDNNIVIVARILTTLAACLLAAAVALVAPAWAREALDLVARWVLMGATTVFVSVALGDFVDGVKPDVARAIGRTAFKVARAAYRVARK